VSLRPAVLTVATAVPLVLAVVAGFGVLGGSRDGDSVPDPTYSPWITAVPGTLDRVGWMLSSVGFAPALTCTALGCLVLAACRRAPEPWRPGVVLARVAGTLAAAGSAVGLLLTALVLVTTYGPLTDLQQQLSQPAPTPDDGTIVVSVVGLGTPWSDAAAVLVPAGICAAAAWVLLRRPRQSVVPQVT
jgi:hypothetical protein